MAETKPKTREGLTLVEIDGEALVYDPENEGVHHLNAIGNVVFQLCDGKATISETACGIAEAFGARIEDVERDVRSMVREFRRLNLLQVKSAAASGRARAGRGKTKRDLIRLEVAASP